MRKTTAISTHTRNNWLLDASLFTSGLAAGLSGISLLFIPAGYQGGRNPYYNLPILFTRHTWEGLHDWGGLIMVGIAVVHILIHWSWITNMTRRAFREIFSGEKRLNNRSRINVAVNAALGITGLVTGVTGVYLFFVAKDSPFQLFFNRATWDLVHTWAGVLMILAGVVHFYIHWLWVTKVTRKVLGGITSKRASQTTGASVHQNT